MFFVPVPFDFKTIIATALALTLSLLFETICTILVDPSETVSSKVPATFAFWDTGYAVELNQVDEAIVTVGVAFDIVYAFDPPDKV